MSESGGAMVRTMKQKNFTHEKIEIYLRHMKEFIKYYGKSPDDMGENEVRQYLNYLFNEKKADKSIVNTAYNVLKLFYLDTLGKEWDIENIEPQNYTKEKSKLSFKNITTRIRKIIDKIKSKGGKVTKVINDLINALPIIKALGFSVKDFDVCMGVIPEINAKICGSIETIDSDKIQKLVDENRDKKILIFILRGLQTASKLKEQIGGMGFKGVEIDIKLGLRPKMMVRFQE